MDHEAEIKALKEKIAQQQKELEMLKRLDEIRDAGTDLAGMTRGVSDLIVETLDAAFCALFLVEPGSQRLTRHTFSDPVGVFAQLDDEMIAQVAGLVGRLSGAEAWQASERLPGAFPAALDDLYLAAAPVIMGQREQLGALLVGRLGRPFNPGDLQLLVTAEDQVDSAVIQGQLQSQHYQALQALHNQQQELSLLKAVDAIRDASSDLRTMLSAIVDLLAGRMHADLCAIFVRDRVTGTPELKAANHRPQHYFEIQRLLTDEVVHRALALTETAAWEFPEPAGTAGEAKTLYLVAVPIILRQESLGTLMLVREQAAFQPEELQLLTAAEDHIDSAIVQCHIYERQQEFATEVETIYEMDRIRDQDLSFDEMLNKVIQALTARINAETAFIMLYDRAGGQLEMRATTHLDYLRTWRHYPALEKVVERALDEARLVCENDLGEGFNSVMCLPLILYDKVIGVLGVLNRYGPYGFTAADQRLLSAIGSQIDTAIYERREIRRLRDVLGRSVGPQVMDRLLANADMDILRPERQEMTVLFADLRGSTLLAEQINPELLVEFIRDFLTSMTEVVLSHEGTIDKFVGDEVMALFGAPMPQVDHALRAIRVGLDMQAAHVDVMARWEPKGVPRTPMGIGIATGKMIVGEMGGSQRSNYTVMGREVNLGSRICGIAGGGQVVISPATYELVRGLVKVVPMAGQRFKGVERDVTVYHVTDILGGG